MGGRRERSARELEEDLDLVALATIADVVPLVGENRTLVRRGLRALAGTAKPGLRALMAVARVDPGKRRRARRSDSRWRHGSTRRDACTAQTRASS